MGAPAIAVARLGNSTDPVVWVAFDVFGPNGLKAIEIIAAHAGDLTKCAPPVFSQPFGFASFSPALSVDGKSNVLDLVHFSFDTSTGTTSSTLSLAKFFTRFDAGALVPVAGAPPPRSVSPAGAV